MKLNRIIVLSVFCSQLNNTKLYSQDSLTKRELINHWVLYSENPNYNSANHDTLEYIPYSLNIVKDLPLHLRYSGTIFEENHVVTHQYWTKCGNETRPAPERRDGKLLKRMKNQYFP